MKIRDAASFSNKGNLSGGEILEQLLHAIREKPFRNVVFMGMGEPLDNTPAVLMAIRTILCNKVMLLVVLRCLTIVVKSHFSHLLKGFNLSKRHVTVSTVGVVPGMRCDIYICVCAILFHARLLCMHSECFYTATLMLRALTREAPGIQLALSLHAPTQQLRNTIVPRCVDNIIYLLSLPVYNLICFELVHLPFDHCLYLSLL